MSASENGAHPATRLLPGTVPPDNATSPLPRSKNLPTSVVASLGIWWNNSSYKEALIAEERMLRRMSVFAPSAAGSARQEGKGNIADKVEDDTVIGEHEGLVATLRHVFVPTPNPLDAPSHPADIAELPARSSRTSLPNVSGGNQKKPSVKKGDELGPGLVDYINTLEISRPELASSKEAVVVLHGYAAALGFFFHNWESIAATSASTGRRTYFLDLLGMGLSSRPSPDLLASPSGTSIAARVARAEHFFVDSLESWRIAVGVSSMILVGHSLGGYLSAAYTVRYPHRVSGLILLSPAGVPRGPGYDRSAAEGQKNEGDLEEATDAAELEINGNKTEDKQSIVRRSAMKVFTWGWERGLSPFMFLRSAGPLGPLWATNYTRRRFGTQKEEDMRDIHSYIYNMSILKGSGEFCISHILAPGAYGRVPIIDRIRKVEVPVDFVYGERDWIDKEGGHVAVKELKKAGNQKATVHIVPDAGHHVYLDNPTETNRIMGEAIKAIQMTI